MLRTLMHRLGGLSKKLDTDQSGISLLYVTISLPAIIGMGLMAIDIGRLSSLQSSLQHGADALALAGAAELDTYPGATTRATNAINNLITTNRSLFATTVVTINGGAVTPCFLASIPAQDTEAITQTCLPVGQPASDTTARFVRVTVTPQNFNTIFPATFVGAASNAATAGAEAVAGFQAAVCDFTPMFICNPYEPVGNTDVLRSAELFDHFNDPSKRRRLINMKQTGGNSAQYFPGNFGWLVPASGTQSAATLREQVGMSKPPACFVASGVELRTGNIESIRFGFNTRFDMYDGPMNSNRNNPLFAPAKNTRKGMATDKNGGKGSPCNPDDDALNANTLPAAYPNHAYYFRDNCFYTNSCPNMGGRMGDGVWNASLYWQKAHEGAALPAALAGNANLSRYDVYKYERDTANMLQDSNGALNGGEDIQARCYNGNANDIIDANAGLDRRLFHAAVLNCRALNSSPLYGPIRGGSGNLLPVTVFAKFFITQAVGGDRGNQNIADGDVWAEMVEAETPGKANSIARDIVQLYR
jgi:Flp pilus assembly protein TadG